LRSGRVAQWCEDAANLQDDGDFEWDDNEGVYPNCDVKELELISWVVMFKEATK
jgi:hypothetical protein